MDYDFSIAVILLNRSGLEAGPPRVRSPVSNKFSQVFNLIPNIILFPPPSTSLPGDDEYPACAGFLRPVYNSLHRSIRPGRTLPTPRTHGANVETSQRELNPLTNFRNSLGLSTIEMGVGCNLSPVIIHLQEQGIPHHLHPRFLSKFPDAVELIPAYHDFRTQTRRRNFGQLSLGLVPTSGPEFREFLDTYGLSPSEFSEMACMPMIDINHALHHWRLPITLVKFFEEVTSSG
jgi:hypothetical protein